MSGYFTLADDTKDLLNIISQHAGATVAERIRHTAILLAIRDDADVVSVECVREAAHRLVAQGAFRGMTPPRADKPAAEGGVRR